MKDLVVVAIGGNSLIKDNEHMSVLDQYMAAGETSHHIADLIEAGFKVVVTHGNGPQVGFILIRSEMAKDKLHQVPLDSCGADTQGAIGYQIAQTLSNELRSRGRDIPIAVIISQTVVDKNDSAFQHPNKPIGPFYSEADAVKHKEADGWDVVEDAGRGWRRVVASPLPLEIVEKKAIEALLAARVIVVCAGGGGIPVCKDESGSLSGVSAVIDKDRASCLLAKNLQAEKFIISTAVDKVAINFNKPDQKNIDTMTVAEARKYMEEGQFAPGSMRPKIEAAIEFLEKGGQEVIITQPHLLGDAIKGLNGTHIVP
ncbi:MAG: carbamate kinase [Spartobacteria bacterium]|nr:carbamate kinase [Spartobacteria bacterium]